MTCYQPLAGEFERMHPEYEGLMVRCSALWIRPFDYSTGVIITTCINDVIGHLPEANMEHAASPMPELSFLTWLTMKRMICVFSLLPLKYM